MNWRHGILPYQRTRAYTRHSTDFARPGSAHARLVSRTLHLLVMKGHMFALRCVPITRFRNIIITKVFLSLTPPRSRRCTFLGRGCTRHRWAATPSLYYVKPYPVYVSMESFSTRGNCVLSLILTFPDAANINGGKEQTRWRQERNTQGKGEEKGERERRMEINGEIRRQQIREQRKWTTENKRKAWGEK
jgi:hypothetical protein